MGYCDLAFLKKRGILWFCQTSIQIRMCKFPRLSYQAAFCRFHFLTQKISILHSLSYFPNCHFNMFWCLYYALKPFSASWERHTSGPVLFGTFWCFMAISLCITKHPGSFNWIHMINIYLFIYPLSLLWYDHLLWCSINIWSHNASFLAHLNQRLMWTYVIEVHSSVVCPSCCYISLMGCLIVLYITCVVVRVRFNASKTRFKLTDRSKAAPTVPVLP